MDCEGNVVPFERAKAPALSLIRFNTTIHGAMKEMVPQMLKNMTPYKEVFSLLTQHKTGLINKSSKLEASG
ncbi:hypothetical protein [Bacillus sp. S/N-304-OC-R1]|uniref:hypothetical protein n=1 Tax=Bacillus sp. S/N-304-OC-R1 TaxID=2758034 RepID=UPI001C8F0499|nr:hypothetical protein [Bacillus sp. S/N-304-OC-R1]MBY0124370.1 hypothetical protein [Bacillus sp. S/N-304-OC-R1]